MYHDSYFGDDITIIYDVYVCAHAWFVCFILTCVVCVHRSAWLLYGHSASIRIVVYILCVLFF